MIWNHLKMDARYILWGMATIPIILTVGGRDPSEGSSKDLDNEGWIPAFAGMTAWKKISGFPSSPRVVARVHLASFVIPAGCGGDPSEKEQDGFPMTNVGNDPDGYGFLIKHYEADYV
jgi:hypothetical protein